MKFNIDKKCNKCKSIWPFDFSFCPKCGKKYRNIKGRIKKKIKMDC
jgi:RNA polymerase subunit RPABC4/transcription elongation factor Spt4